MKYFLEAQGHTITGNYLEQDNESAIKLALNGRRSAGPKSRHIGIRYFWLKDRLRAGGITVRHCPTLAMLADFFTKPLQGHLFYKFRDALLGYTSVAALATAPDVPLEERVGDRRIGTVDDATTGMHSNSEVATWADIVRLTPKDRTSEHTASKTAKAVAGRRTTRAVSDKNTHVRITLRNPL